MWKADTSKVVAPTCVGKGSMGWPPRASIERTDHILVYEPNKLMYLCNQLGEASLLYSKAVVREGE
jgi:hypothetical protein